MLPEVTTPTCGDTQRAATAIAAAPIHARRFMRYCSSTFNVADKVVGTDETGLLWVFTSK